jgi:hypothetical protein
VVPILFRAFSTIVTVVIAVGVSASLGETAAGKIWAAVLIAAVIALVEWLLIWAPRHSAVARRLLDPRSALVGVWLQDVRRVLEAAPGPDGASLNRFAIFWVEYGDGEYDVSGFAFDPTGVEHSRWWSEGVPEFAKDGRSMTYRWNGTTMMGGTHGQDMDRTGICRLDLRAGTGRIQHVGMRVDLIFDFFQVTQHLLDDMSLRLGPADLKTFEGREVFAREYARKLAPSVPMSRGAPIPMTRDAPSDVLSQDTAERTRE